MAEHAIMHHVPYHEAVRALNWAALATCPDIAFSVTTVTRSTANPRPPHWEAVKQIYCYLAGIHDLWLSYGETQQVPKGYADADRSMAKDRHAITGYAIAVPFHDPPSDRR